MDAMRTEHDLFTAGTASSTSAIDQTSEIFVGNLYKNLEFLRNF